MGDKGELFAEEVRAARANNFPIIMVHENDEAAGGCEFARFFESTPQDLIADGLYKALAYAWYPEPFRAVSVALVAQAFGAEEPESKNPMDQVKRLGRKALRAMLPAAALAALAKMLDTRRDRHRKKHHLSADAADVIVSKAVAEAEASSRARAEASGLDKTAAGAATSARNIRPAVSRQSSRPLDEQWPEGPGLDPARRRRRERAEGPPLVQRPRFQRFAAEIGRPRRVRRAQPPDVAG